LPDELNLSLREATPADQSFLLDVYASTRIDELAPLDWSDDQKRAFIKMQYVTRERIYPQGDNQIIVVNGREIGRILVDRGETSIRLIDIALLTEYRNAGIGTRLLRDLIKESTAAGKPIVLHVLATSPAARLYERLGFRQTGYEAAYFEMKWEPATS
jgi:ribosomal protein S18 acetylase RimI-like enzyme